MIRTSGLISARRVAFATELDRERFRKRSIFSKRCALLTAASVLALVTAGSLPANAQTASATVITTIAPVIPPQTGPSPNNLAIAIAVGQIADTDASIPSTPLVVFDSALAQAIALSTVDIDLSLSQTNTGTSAATISQANSAAIAISVSSAAHAGLVDIDNTSGLVTVGTIALSQATSSVSVDLGLTQTNTNAGVSNVASTTQTVDQTNASAFAASILSSATADAVNVSSSGDVNEPTLDGINAASVALSTVAINDGITQSNSNSLSGSTTVNNQPLTQAQTVSQTNSNAEAVSLASQAESGPVTVSRDGLTTAAGDGVIGSSVATASSAITSTVGQSNTNSASASTTGNGTSGTGSRVNQSQDLSSDQHQLTGLQSQLAGRLW